MRYCIKCFIETDPVVILPGLINLVADTEKQKSAHWPEALTFTIIYLRLII
jgi:hypothetical protein